MFLDTRKPFSWACLTALFLLDLLKASLADDATFIEPVKLIPLYKTPIKEGTGIEMKCVQGPNDKPVNVLKWEHNNRPLERCNGFLIISPKETNYKLYIFNAQLTDAGTYRCTAEVNGRVQRVNQTISITPSGTHSGSIATVTAVVGSAATLRCRGENRWSIAWTKNGIRVKTATVINSCYSGSELVMRKVTWEHNGTYACTCTYYNRGEPLRATQTIRLVIQPAMETTAAPTPTYTSGTVAETTTAAPTPTYTGGTVAEPVMEMTAAPTPAYTSSIASSRVDAGYTVSLYQNVVRPSSSSGGVLNIAIHSKRVQLSCVSDAVFVVFSSSTNAVILHSRSPINAVIWRSSADGAVASASSRDPGKEPSWVVAALAFCFTFGILGIVIAVVAFFFVRHVKRHFKGHDKSSDMHSGKSRSEIDSICNDAVARSNSEAPCTTRLSLRLHYTAPDKSSSRHDFQPRPEIDSNGYATVRDYCHDTRKTNLELPTTTEITPMARKLATPNRERIQVSKRFALPNSTDVTSDSQQYEDMRL